jgi:hypothetical protein
VNDSLKNFLVVEIGVLAIYLIPVIVNSPIFFTTLPGRIIVI